MKPYFSFNFWNKEYKSETVEGNNPIFWQTETLKIEDYNKFTEYIKNEKLTIDFFDSSISSDNGTNFIGSVQIDLNLFIGVDYDCTMKYPILNEKKNESKGEAFINIRLFKS